jgi:DNA-binding transcriptional MerR regulator
LVSDHGCNLRSKLGLLTQEELAQLIDVSPDTLREWRRLKQGPDYVKAGKSVMYREKDVLRWLERNLVPVG